MAKVIFGPIVSDARGKCGDVVFSRYSSGAVSHAVPKLVNPKSPEQQIVRGNMRNTGKAWYQTLSDQQRRAWDTLGAAIKHTDRYRQAFSPVGQTLFCLANLNTLLAGGAPVLEAPQQLSAPDPGPLSASADANALTLTLNPTVTCPAGHGIICMATKPVNPGRNWWAKYLRILRNYDLTPLPPTALPDIGGYYVHKFGPMPPGKNIGITLSYVNLTTGAKSPAQSTLVRIGGTQDMLYQIKITLTADQLLALGTTPVLAIPAPPAGFTIRPITMTAHYKFKTTPFNFPPGTLLQYGASSPLLYKWPCLDLIDTMNNVQDTWQSWTNPGPTNTLYLDQSGYALYLTLADGSATTGDGSLVITIDYVIDPTN